MTRTKAFLRRLTTVGAVLAVVAMVTASAAAASTNVPIWTSGGTHLKFGENVTFSGASSTGMDLKWKAAGIPYWIECENLSGSGTVENYASGKAGTLASTAGAFKFVNCFVAEVGEQTAGGGTTCYVPSEIPVQINTGELTNTPYTAGGLQLSNLSMEFQINGCPHGFGQGYTWHVAASPTGNEGAGAVPGEVLFPEGSSVKLNGSISGEMRFGLEVQDSGSSPIKIGEEAITEPSNPGHHYWYIGGGMRKGEGPRTLVAAGSPLSFSGGTNTITIEATIGGVAVKISCSGSGSATGSVENPVGGADGIATATFGFTSCIVVKPEKPLCSVETGAFSAGPMSGSLILGEQWPPIGFTTESKTLSTLTVGGASCPPSLKGTYKVSGTLAVQPYLSLSSPNRWQIPKALNTGGTILLRGQVATAYGEVTVEHAGEVVTLD
jgi:hypothetical protein